MIQKNGFLDNSGRSAFKSREGVLWISTGENNLYRLNTIKKSFLTLLLVVPLQLLFMKKIPIYFGWELKRELPATTEVN